MRGNGQTQQRSEVATTISGLLNNWGGGGLTCIRLRRWKPIQVPGALVDVQCIFPPVSLCVMFVTTWKLEAAALIETHPSPPTHSFSLFQNSLCICREKKGKMKRKEEKDGGSAWWRGKWWKKKGGGGGGGKIKKEMRTWTKEIKVEWKKEETEQTGIKKDIYHLS